MGERIVAFRTKTLRVLRVAGEVEALRMLTDRREALTPSPVHSRPTPGSLG